MQEAILGDWRLASLSANDACSVMDSWFLGFTSQPEACLGWDALRRLSQQLQQAARSMQPDQPEGPCASAWDSLRTDHSAEATSHLVPSINFLVKPRGGARRLRRLGVRTSWCHVGPVTLKAFTDDGSGWRELCTRSAVPDQPLELPLDVHVLPEVRSSALAHRAQPWRPSPAIHIHDRGEVCVCAELSFPCTCRECGCAWRSNPRY